MLNEAKANYIETMMVIADSQVVLDVMAEQKESGTRKELADRQKETFGKLEQIDEFWKKINATEKKDAAYFEDMRRYVAPLIESSRLQISVERSQYRHICRDYEEMTGKSLSP